MTSPDDALQDLKRAWQADPEDEASFERYMQYAARVLRPAPVPAGSPVSYALFMAEENISRGMLVYPTGPRRVGRACRTTESKSGVIGAALFSADAGDFVPVGFSGIMPMFFRADEPWAVLGSDVFLGVSGSASGSSDVSFARGAVSFHVGVLTRFLEPPGASRGELHEVAFQIGWKTIF